MLDAAMMVKSKLWLPLHDLATRVSHEGVAGTTLMHTLNMSHALLVGTKYKLPGTAGDTDEIETPRSARCEVHTFLSLGHWAGFACAGVVQSLQYW